MLLRGVPLLLPLLISSVGSANIPTAIDCSKPQEAAEECAQPIEHVVAVVPGSSYVAKIDCKDCPYYERGSEPNYESKESKTDQILWFNISVSHDRHTLLLNSQPFYPLPTIPTPPPLWTRSYAPTFSHTNLSAGLTCVSNPTCDGGWPFHDDCAQWCGALPLSASRVYLDYLYVTSPTDVDANKDGGDAEYWHVALDVIGNSRHSSGSARWEYADPDLQMVWMLIKGTPQKARGGPKAASDLFGSFSGNDKRFEFEIVDVRLVARAYTFGTKKPLTLFRRIGRFFGADVWQAGGTRFLFLSDEWGSYGKKATLRDMFGEFVHWYAWELVGIVFGSVVGGLLGLFCVYRFFWWVVGQRELMKWDGMEDVWENLRRERLAEEEGALLAREGAYRDDPEDEGATSSRPVMKPLPSKPLPEKPLPEVPLIDT
ncbi:hypothetical protein BDW02DRAFT_500858 [Decorospora gaudefroyi]|uniref:Uncharacterized protein n=1 Tax=Decorospora gaudefroyi TaxID=184978 RepID=A0A6A5KAP7_9PLEO|nr:hypothetical protein BDW02DRAFT_500858 [Decorospora gaudefroyi]